MKLLLFIATVYPLSWYAGKEVAHLIKYPPTESIAYYQYRLTHKPVSESALPGVGDLTYRMDIGEE